MGERSATVTTSSAAGTRRQSGCPVARLTGASGRTLIFDDGTMLALPHSCRVENKGAAFLIEGTDESNANVLTNGVPQRIRVEKR